MSVFKTVFSYYFLFIQLHTDQQQRKMFEKTKKLTTFKQNL